MGELLNLSIVIPNWNGRPLLAEFIPSVLAAAKQYSEQQMGEVEVIVVDDASTDDSVSWLAENYPQDVRVVKRIQNGGFVRAVNTGFASARFPIVLLLNNDVQIDCNAIAPLVSHFADRQLFAVCCKAYRLGTDLFDGAAKMGLFEKGFWRVFQNYDILPTRLPKQHEPFYSFFASGGYAAFDAAKFSELGGFCEILVPIYWEDVELSYRAWKHGWKVHYEPASIVHHKSSATMKEKFKAQKVQIITERNRLLAHWINLHDPIWFVSHLAWLALKLLSRSLLLDHVLWRAFFQALARVPAVRRARKREKAASVRSDREIAALFAPLIANEAVVVIRNKEEYYKYVDEKRRLESGV